MTGLFSKAQHDLSHLFTRPDLIHLGDSQGTSSSSYDDSSPEISPSPSPTISRHPGAVTITDVFEHPTHTVTRTVIRPSPSHSLFSLPFKRSSGSSSGSKSGSKSFFRTSDPSHIADPRTTFEEELSAYAQRWEDEREGRNAMDVYIVVDRESSHEESWRSLVQEIHYNHHPPTRKVSSECGRW